jgi:hypothetical protein
VRVKFTFTFGQCSQPIMALAEIHRLGRNNNPNRL